MKYIDKADKFDEVVDYKGIYHIYRHKSHNRFKSNYVFNWYLNGLRR